MSRTLVTGGSGYFGAVMVKQLLSAGHDVRVLDLNDADDRPADVEFVRGDIRDPAAVAAAVKGIDVVYNNVAQVPLAKDHELLRTVNVDGTLTLLQACVVAGTSKIVHTSSSAVFGVPRSNPVTESTVPSPAEAYGHAKLAGEWICLDHVSRGLDVSIVRPRTILGHGRLGIFGILFDWIADGADVFVLGDGANKYQFVHADDLAAACVLAGASAGAEIFNIGTDRFGTMRKTLQTVCDHAGTGSQVRSLPAKPTSLAMHAAASMHIAPFAPYHWLMYAQSMYFDTTKATEKLGWTATYSNAEMFADSYDWFLENRAITTSAGASHHRRTAKQGALRLLKSATRLLP